MLIQFMQVFTKRASYKRIGHEMVVYREIPDETMDVYRRIQKDKA